MTKTILQLTGLFAGSALLATAAAWVSLNPNYAGILLKQVLASAGLTG